MFCSTYTTDHTRNPSRIAATAAIIPDTFSRYCASSPASRRVLAAVAHDRYLQTNKVFFSVKCSVKL